MKGLNKTLTIIAIVLNAVFLAGIIYGMTRFGVHPSGLLDLIGCIFILVFPAVTLVTFLLTFHKKAIILTSVLRIITVIVNILFLIILISAIALKDINLAEFAQLLVVIFGLGLPVLNILALALPFRKPKAAIPD
ncbi:MAG: hypothetical protein ACYS67_17405 [Planctomycetota bacterium]|jgi:hypothetical protein